MNRMIKRVLIGFLFLLSVNAHAQPFVITVKAGDNQGLIDAINQINSDNDLFTRFIDIETGPNGETGFDFIEAYNSGNNALPVITARLSLRNRLADANVRQVSFTGTGQQDFRLIAVTGFGTLSIGDSVIQDFGINGENGGSILVTGEGSFSARNGRFENNFSNMNGGAISLEGQATGYFGFGDGNVFRNNFAGVSGCDLNIQTTRDVSLENNVFDGENCPNVSVENPFGTMAVSANTFIHSGNAIDSTATAQLSGNIFQGPLPVNRLNALSPGPSKPEAACNDSGSGAFDSKGYNISTDDSCSLDQGSDQPNTNPMLSFNQNGLPILNPGSPAIDAGNDSVLVFETNPASDPSSRCTGYGNLQSISLSDWELGLGAWTVGTHDVANPGTFDTPDWAVVGSLPDNRAGMAAFVADLDISLCGADDETGALTLDSPPIVIPGGVQVPRVSVDHWFDTEFGWDGGNFKISVNGGAFSLIPASAIEIGPYNDTLFPILDEFGSINNSNPLAEEDAFTGTYQGLPTGSWVKSHINLLGIASAGDTVKLRFDFGVDTCEGTIGWYVDDVEFYSCEAELPPSNCGNGVIDAGEQCDDGNNFIDDGCSNTCQIESGWQCTSPTPAGTIADPSFEAGRPNPFWTEVSNNGLGSPICDAATCNLGGGTGPSDGTFWVWLGGVSPFQEGSVSQSIVIPPTVTALTFDLEVPTCDSASDYFEVLIDGNQELLVDGSSPRCGIVGYATQFVDISAYADGLAHDLEIHSVTISDNGGVSNFFIDAIAMPGSPSACERDGTVESEDMAILPCGYMDINGMARPQDGDGDGGFECDPGASEFPGTGSMQAGHSGAFFNALRNGEGNYVEILSDNIAVVYTFTFRPDGSGPSWFIGVGDIRDNSIVIEDLLRPTGTSFGSGFDAAAIDYSDAGGMSMIFPSCEATGGGGGVAYSGNPELGYEGLLSRAQRITAITGCSYTPTANAGLSGSFFDPARSGEGLIIEWLTNGDVVAIFFTYDQNGDQFWTFGIGTPNGKSVTINALYPAASTVWGRNFVPGDVDLQPWGTFDLTWTACDTLDFDYNSTVPGYGSGSLDYTRASTLQSTTCPQF